MHELNDVNAKGSSTHLPDSESEEHILGNRIIVSKAILKSITHPKEDEEYGGRKDEACT